MDLILKHAVADELAAAAEGCVTALRAAVVMHDGNVLL